MTSEDSTWPLVSLVMPVRNERNFITTCIEQVLSQDYPPDRLEILVADGRSDDGTREILDELATREPRVRVVDNPLRIVAPGLNAVIAAARGEIIVRLDGHAEIAEDFVRQNVMVLREHLEAWCVGGPIQHVGTTSFGKAVAAAMGHPLGVGNANYRYPEYEGYAESAQFPALYRWVFDRIGYFDEALVRTEDDEFNYRIIQAGGKIYISPRIRYGYYVRNSVGQLAKQYFQYSFWRFPVLRKHHRLTTLRQIIPTLFYLLMLGLLILGVALHNPWIAFALPSCYLGALLAAGITLIPRLGLAPALLTPLAIIVMHASYAWGYLYGFWAGMFRPQAWHTQGNMATLSR